MLGLIRPLALLQVSLNLKQFPQWTEPGSGAEKCSTPEKILQRREFLVRQEQSVCVSQGLQEPWATPFYL